jgi:hypothetical protein
VLTYGPLEFGACFVHDRISYNGITASHRNRRATPVDVELVSLADEFRRHLAGILCPLERKKWNRLGGNSPGNWLIAELERSLRRTGTDAAWRLHRAIYSVAEPSTKIVDGVVWHRIDGKWMRLVSIGADGPDTQSLPRKVLAPGTKASRDGREGA